MMILSMIIITAIMLGYYLAKLHDGDDPFLF